MKFKAVSPTSLWICICSLQRSRHTLSSGKANQKKPNELLKSKYTSKQPFYICLSKYTVFHISSILCNISRSQHLRHHKSHSLRQCLPVDSLGHCADQQPNHSWVHHATDFQAAGRDQPRLPACRSATADCSCLRKLQLKARIPRRTKHSPNSSCSDPWSLKSLTFRFSTTKIYQRPSTPFSPVFSLPTDAIIKIK